MRCHFAFLVRLFVDGCSVGGFNEEDSREMAVRLEAAGVDLIELSGGTYESLGFHHKKDSTKKREAFFIEYVE